MLVNPVVSESTAYKCNPARGDLASSDCHLSIRLVQPDFKQTEQIDKNGIKEATLGQGIRITWTDTKVLKSIRQCFLLSQGFMCMYILLLTLIRHFLHSLTRAVLLIKRISIYFLVRFCDFFFTPRIRC